jgi:hypothetical protein
MPIDQTRGRAMAEAITAPSALLLAGAGASVAILAGAPLVVAGVVAAAAWSARVWQRMPKVSNRERIDLYELRDPWRHFVRDAIHARDKFAKAVSSTADGPLRDRLAEVAARVEDAVQECWVIARQGQQLARAVRELDVADIRRELASVEDAARRSPQRDELRATVTSLEAQLESASRLTSVTQDTADKLTRINAELDEAVARAVELSVSPATAAGLGDAAGVSPLGTDVENIVGELESLRVALDEVGRA